jgi:F-type H+-transporting ATPase subunit c
MAMTTRTTTSTATAPRPTTDPFPLGACPSAHDGNPTKSKRNHMITTIAELQGNIASAFGLLGAAIGVGLIGLKAAEAVGRNPAASGKVLVQAIIGMALAEGLGILALFLAK